MDKAHTPGPWRQSHRECEDGMWSTQVYDAQGETIADVAWYPVPYNGGVATSREANARLIASAPELLAALKAVQARRIVWPAEIETQVTAAIANAEGR